MYGRIGRQKMLAEIYKECGSIFGKGNTPMTDKQIIIDGCDVSGCEYWKGYCRIASLCDYAGHLCEVNPNCYYKQLKRKEQECEELKKIINEAKNSKLDLKSFLVGEAVQNEYEQQLDQLKQTLAEIKPILELYANSKVGDEQPDGTYKLSGGIWDSFGFCVTTYDPRPAREGLKKISEVEDV